MANFSALRNIALAKQRAAAEVIANAIRAASGSFSRRIPGSVRVIQTGGSRFSVVAGGDAAPNAYPFETGARHPLFGNKKAPWYPQPKKPFLEEGAAAGITEAANVFATFIDDVGEVLNLEVK